MLRLASLFFLTLSLSAQAAPRDDKIRDLMQAQGLLQMMETQLEAGKDESRKQVRQISDDLIARLKPNAEYRDKFQQAFDGFVVSLNRAWRPGDLVEVWAKAYGSQFSDKELDSLLAYYKSPLGQKDVKAAQAAMPAIAQYFTQQVAPVTEREAKAYLDKLEKLVDACKCPR